MTDAEARPRKWTGVRVIEHEWKERGHSTTVFNADDMRTVTEVPKNGAVLTAQEIQQIRQCIRTPGTDLGDVIEILDAAKKRTHE